MRSLIGIAKSKRVVLRVKSTGFRFSVFAALSCCLLLAVLCPAVDVSAGAQSGLVYVLDSGGASDKPQILLVDAAQKQIVRKIATQRSADMALSPDGARLYVASTNDVSSRLDIYDGSSGKLLRSLDNKDRWLPTSQLYITHMAMSPDGKWLYIFKYEIATDMYYIATFDTTREAFLAEPANLPECLNAVISPSSEGRQLAVLCTSSNDLRFVKIMEDGKGKISRLPLRLRGRNSRFGLTVGLSNLVPSAQGYKAVLGDGSFFEVSSEGKRIDRLGVLDANVRKIGYNESPSIVAADDDWMGGKWLPIQYPAFGKSGKVYIGISQISDIRRASWAFSQIGVFDSDTLNRTGVIDSSRRLFSITVNSAGDRLYGIDPYTKTLVVFDTGSGKEIATVDGLGENPMMVIAAP
jgi:DNA-binding beta-propeller fold protein YncE